MRLINATTKELEVFYDVSSRPPYAILSHRWVDGNEVTFEDMQRPHRQWMPAWPKITMCCQQALADGLNYVWVDTCCIDKNSSAELSEAINSMYMWYSHADRCYAYLNDVVCALYDQLDTSSFSHSIMPTDMVEKIIASNWFTRAWTLQELIAPTKVILYDSSFRSLGSKVDFAAEIEHAFAIPAEVLMNPDRLWEYPIAVRMSWAARRRATRTEDIAYSLFGLFGVNLPLLYGEGTRSFLRLQEEIIRQTYDHSIFLWSQTRKLNGMRSDGHETGPYPLLAFSPANFEDCQDIILPEDTKDVRPYAITNVGLQIELRIFPYDLDVYVGLLNCNSKSTGDPYGILLARSGDKTNIWRRLCVKGVDVLRIQRPEKLKTFVWQNMYIIRDNTVAFNTGKRLHQPDTNHSCIPFYGLHIRAPAFLVGYAEPRQPYTLSAHYDWNLTSKILDCDEYGRYMQPGYMANTEACSISLPPIGHTMSVDQTLTLTGFRESSRREAIQLKKITIDRPIPDVEQRPEAHNRNHRYGGLNATSGPASGSTLGILAMPLMSTGTAGIIIYDEVVDGIRSIKAGFDFDFRPVIFVATHEAEAHPPWLQLRRYEHLESFEKFCKMTEGLVNSQPFWTLGPDHLRDQKDLRMCDDGSILISKGIYAFTCEATAGPEHWIFKPDESQCWHFALGLEKREYDGLMYWEFTMDKRDDLVKLEFELVS